MGVGPSLVGSLAHMTATPGTQTLRVRPLRSGDLDFAARLHADGLGHGFFARLGTGFLAAYYETFVASPHAVAFLGLVDGRPAGQVVGPVRNRSHHRWVVRHRGWSLGARLVLALLARPRLLVHFLRTRAGRYVGALGRLLRGGGSGGEGHGGRQGRQGPAAVLSHVCVSAHARGRGLGSALVDAFTDAARQAGATEVLLVTLVGEDGAEEFWSEQGWARRHERTDFEERPITVYARSLP